MKHSNLADEFGSLHALMEADLPQLESINQIGPVLAKSIHEYLHNPENVRVIEDLLNSGVKPSSPVKKASGTLEGKSIVVTGTMENFSRQAIEQTIKDHGGKTSSSVSSKTSFVLAGENPGGKLEKARKLGVKTLDEPAFLRLLDRARQGKPPGA